MEFLYMNDYIPTAIIPDGYQGKILLLRINGDGIEDIVVLRSGDIWHSEILRAAEMEISECGVKKLRVCEAGGAWVRFNEDGTVMIYGQSEEFGACDKGIAAKLLRQLYPNKTVYIED